MDLHDLLKLMVEKEASDLHITAGTPPQLRIDGTLSPVPEVESLAPADTKRLCYSVLTDAQRHKYELENELDLSFGIKDLARFRANIFAQRGCVAGAFRTIPTSVLNLEALGLPPVVKEITKKPKGLVLVTGPTGSGKSTTLAAMIDEINRTRHEHIVTIEDPIEYVHSHKSSIVNQREINSDTMSFRNALKYILRQDPDVVLIGELRDLETIESALIIAETGHLALASLHTNSCVQTINRILDVFPPIQQAQVRSQISMVLEGILCQTLVPRANGKGRVLAIEVLIPNPAIRNLIREEKVHQIYSHMQVGQSKFHMQTKNQALYNLYKRGIISHEDAITRTREQEELRNMIVSQPTFRRT